MKKNATEVLKKLNDAGFEAYFVGGAVRDFCLGKSGLSDYDICTNALPEQTKQVFHKTFDTGIKHGTITVRHNSESFEITTYRIDGEYSDSRRPDEVTFTTDLKEDLVRRDFTINSMAMDANGGITDPHQGREDLKNGIIRAVGEPNKRFREDPLRILRGIRFLSQLGHNFRIEEKTLEAMGRNSYLLQNTSPERIRTELVKTITGSNLDALKIAYQAGITKHFLPEFDIMMQCQQETPHHCYDVGNHTIVAMKNISNDETLRLTMLLHDVAKPVMKTFDETGAHFRGHQEKGAQMSQEILRRLRFDNDTIKRVAHLIRYHDYELPTTSKACRKALRKIGKDFFEDYLQIRTADISAQSDFKKGEKLNKLKTARLLYAEIIESNEPTSLKDLKINGNDLVKLGHRPGRGIGIILDDILTAVIEDPGLNEKCKLIELIKKYPLGSDFND